MGEMDKWKDGKWYYTTDGCGCCEDYYDEDSEGFSLEDINKDYLDLLNKLKVFEQFYEEKGIDIKSLVKEKIK